MKRIDSRTVELTEAEVKVSDRFHALLDTGLGITEAARTALREVRNPRAPRLPLWVSAEFVEYLSDGTLSLHHGVVVAVRQ